MTSGPMLLVGLDAAEWELIQRLVGEGTLPALGAMLASGRYGRLQSVAAHYAGGVWPTFYTGRDVPWHGVYHSKLWRHEHMRCEMANGTWLPAQPFWERPEAQRLRSCVIDVPMTVEAPAPLNGLQLAGWGTHDLLIKGAYPKTLWRELRRHHGRPCMEPERFGPQDGGSLLRLRDNMLAATRQIADISVALLKRERWDFFCHVFGAPHRAGHYLWDQSQVDLDGFPPSARHDLNSALVDVYRACDDGLARLLGAVAGDMSVLVFAVHGMGKNRGWSDLCPDLLARMQHGGDAPAPRQGLLYRMKRRLPVRRTEDVVALLPLRLRHRLVPLWSARMFDWNSTRYFPLPMDQAGYLRINLQGREPGGVVPLEEYDALCNELTAGLMGWKDLDTGLPIVEAVDTAYANAKSDAPYRDRLPDLIVTWSEQSALSSRGVRSSDFGELTFPTRGRVPSGRSGNHTGHGWFVLTGPDVEPGEVRSAHILDLAPMICRRLGLAVPPDMQGRVIAGC